MSDRDRILLTKSSQKVVGIKKSIDKEIVSSSNTKKLKVEKKSIIVIMELFCVLSRAWPRQKEKILSPCEETMSPWFHAND